jgi:hypothetical protein
LRNAHAIEALRELDSSCKAFNDGGDVLFKDKDASRLTVLQAKKATVERKWLEGVRIIDT